MEVDDFEMGEGGGGGGLKPLFGLRPHKRSKHSNTIFQQFGDGLFECLTILWGWRFKD